MNVAAIFAGGVGTRMNSKSLPKQFLKLHGKPIIVHTLEVFDKHDDIDLITVACLKAWIPYLEELILKYNIKKVGKIVPGGDNGQESIYNALMAIEDFNYDKKDTIVLIHDGVRPLINERTITENIESVIKNGSAITSTKVSETVLVVGKNKAIDYIPERKNSRLARAPQSFYLDEILSAHIKAREEGLLDFIDSCSMMKYYGKDLYLIEGPKENIKITSPADLYIMRAILDEKENSQIYGFDINEE